jgi:membrane protease subunit HflK
MLLGWLTTGFYVVRPGETAVVRRFGRSLIATRGPGMHLGGPYGVDRVVRVRPREVRRLELGGMGVARVGEAPGVGEYLTGDLNLVRARAVVQYRVSDPRAFAVLGEAVEPVLARLAESSLARALSRQGIEATLRDGRASAASETADELTRAADRLALGVAILGVSLTDARPPDEVAEAFTTAQAARNDRDRRVTEARTTAATMLTTAGATAAGRVEAARAAGDRAMALAHARAERFASLLAESRRAPRLTATRLYHDTLRTVLPRLRRKIVTPDEPLDLSILGVR